MRAKSLLSCPALCDSLYCSSPSSSVCGILQARSILASRSGLPWPSPGDLPYPGIELVSLTSPPLADGFFTASATWAYWELYFIPLGKWGKKKVLFDSGENELCE